MAATPVEPTLEPPPDVPEPVAAPVDEKPVTGHEDTELDPQLSEGHDLPDDETTTVEQPVEEQHEFAEPVEQPVVEQPPPPGH